MPLSIDLVLAPEMVRWRYWNAVFIFCQCVILATDLDVFNKWQQNRDIFALISPSFQIWFSWTGRPTKPLFFWNYGVFCSAFNVSHTLVIFQSTCPPQLWKRKGTSWNLLNNFTWLSKQIIRFSELLQSTREVYGFKTLNRIIQTKSERWERGKFREVLKWIDFGCSFSRPATWVWTQKSRRSRATYSKGQPAAEGRQRAPTIQQPKKKRQKRSPTHQIQWKSRSRRLQPPKASSWSLS